MINVILISAPGETPPCLIEDSSGFDAAIKAAGFEVSVMSEVRQPFTIQLPDVFNDELLSRLSTNQFLSRILVPIVVAWLAVGTPRTVRLSFDDQKAAVEVRSLDELWQLGERAEALRADNEAGQ